MIQRNRQSIRIPGYDYAQDGYYFVTICTNHHELLFGDVVDGKVVLNEFGVIVKKCWNAIPEHFSHIILDKYIIMPNHVHGILVMNGKNVGAKNISPLRLPNANKFQSPSKSIGSFVRGFKIGVTKWFRKNTDIYSVWQRNYYEHVIRDEKDLNHICEYIITAQAVPFGNNPLKWAYDEYYL